MRRRAPAACPHAYQRQPQQVKSQRRRMPSVERDVPPDPREPRTRGPLVPAGPRVRRPGERHRGPLRQGRRGLRVVLGRPGPQPALAGARTSPRSSTGARHRSPRGSPTASSTSPTTASTGTSRPATATRWRIHFVGEPDGDTRDITYAELHEQVQKAANALQDLGVGKGDTVAIYLPMIPEAAVAMLACARIGAPHSVVFGGFSAEALYTRINDAKCKLVDHLRRGLPARGAGGPQAGGGRRAGQGRDDRRARARRQADRSGHRVERRATSGGTRRWRRRPTPTRRRAWRPSTRCSSSTRPAPPGSPRASSTPPAATSRRPPTPTRSCTTCTRRPTSTGAPPTSAGSPATPTSSTGRWPTARRR